ncbi:resuscitation-promoting factor [Actinomadura hibisca]|uniref:resuscitation-promoting factor n=1 Tax=Actinomadura hibisca TaxID=68565 RepID=UPI000B033BAE|nr:resuscitation-promoting factor [Actinomadura hibisca]
MRRPPALPVLLLTAALAAGCGGGGDAAKPKTTAPLADAPKASTPAPTPRPVVVTVDKKRRTVSTTGKTVLEVLTQAGIELGPYDLVAPPRESTAGRTIKVVRLLSKPVTKTVAVEPPTIKKKSSKVPPFSEKELRKGKPGLTVVQTAYVQRRGKKVKVVLSSKVKRKPVARILGVGPQSAAGGSAARLNWAGLAKCESGGNPRAVNPAGYYGLYQFSMQTWTSVGGSGKPSDASAGEQTYRAQLLYNKVNGRWQGQWPNCGKFLFS